MKYTPPLPPSQRPTCRLEGLRDHVVDEAVRVGDASRLELLLVFVLVNLLEDVLEPPVVRLLPEAQRPRQGTKHNETRREVEYRVPLSRN